jgi:TPR repeat protein
MLSWMLVDGDHRQPDHKEAMRWALKAAEQGVAASMTRIGLLYNNALGVERDVEAAASWWRKAALLGDADGQAMLGAAYHLGAGVARDPVAALAWLIRGRAARSPFADRFYAGVRQSCTAEQIREAERRADLPLERAGHAEAAP